MSRNEGSAWLKAGTSALLAVPSVIIDEEDNILINPAHVDSVRIVASKLRRFVYDHRVRRVVSLGHRSLPPHANAPAGSELAVDDLHRNRSVGSAVRLTPHELPIRLEWDSKIELPSRVGAQEFQEFVPAHKSTINDNTLRVESAADAFERHLDRRTVLNEKALAESLANFAP